MWSAELHYALRGGQPATAAMGGAGRAGSTPGCSSSRAAGATGRQANRSGGPQTSLIGRDFEVRLSALLPTDEAV